MDPGRFSCGWLLAVSLAAAPAGAQTVVSDAAGLVAAIEDRETEIHVAGVIEFDARYQATNNALPVIDYRVVEIRGQPGAELSAAGSGFRLMEIIGDGRVELSDLTVSGFSTVAPGGAILVDDADLTARRIVFRGNHSGRNGGALHVQQGFPVVRAEDTVFEENSAGMAGGAISVSSFDRFGQLVLVRSRLIDNEAPAGCAVSLRRTKGSSFIDSLFRGACDQALVDVEFGRQGFNFFRNTFLAGPGRTLHYRVREGNQPMQNDLFGNLFLRDRGSGTLCAVEVTGEPERAALRSLGQNVGTDDSCGLAEESDRLVDDVSSVLDGVVPVIGGPAVDVLDVPETIISGDSRRCSIADANGLGRPQDADGDGEPACDTGAVEARNGPDLGPAQSGAYFDPGRDGEGYFVEILEGGRAWVTLFSYTPVGGSPPLRASFPAWFHGLGRVVGNSIVVPRFHSSRGGRFGEAFDP